METFKRTPLQLFNLPHHFVIPLSQRPYVWKVDLQWEPLRKAIRRVITKLEPYLLRTVTGLTVDAFNLLVPLNVFNRSHTNQAVFALRRYEDASLSCTGIESHEGLRHFGHYDTVIAKEA
ncbi:hypothetical protein ACFQW6_13640 [Nocardioides sp. GCM10028917]|uniref:hypothetical protein n=1 Tax=Nocardioides sp. GCM10028917 TaxID=3273408 RepID=UPI00360B8D2B